MDMQKTAAMCHEVINVNLRAPVVHVITMQFSTGESSARDQVDFNNSRKTVRDLHKKRNAILTWYSEFLGVPMKKFFYSIDLLVLGFHVIRLTEGK